MNSNLLETDIPDESALSTKQATQNSADLLKSKAASNFQEVSHAVVNHAEHFIKAECSFGEETTGVHMNPKLRSLDQKKKPVAFVAQSQEGLKAMAPLVKEMENSSNSRYFPVLIVTPTMPPLTEIDVEKLVGVSTSTNDLGCRYFSLTSTTDPKVFEAAVGLIDPVAFIGVKEERGILHVRAIFDELDEDYRTPLILLPSSEFRFVTWLSHCAPEALLNWYIPQITISIITANRPDSLQRLLNSLKSAVYLGDEVQLIISAESFADMRTLNIMNQLEWPYGQKISRHRVKQGGLIAAVMESWYPNGYDEYGILLEDDIEVSTYFYVWCRYNLMTYRYGSPEDWKGGLFGISLYTPRKLELVEKKETRWDSNAFFEKNTGDPYTPFFQPLVCSWGAMFFPKVWMEFHLYAAKRIETNIHVEIAGSKSNSWSGSWKKFFYEMAYIMKYYMIYPNFKNQHSFSTNHMGAGEHIKTDGGDDKHRPEDFTVPLIEKYEDIFDQLPNGKLPSLNKLPAISLFGKYEKQTEKYFLESHLVSSYTFALKVYDAYLKCVGRSKSTGRKKKCAKSIKVK